MAGLPPGRDDKLLRGFSGEFGKTFFIAMCHMVDQCLETAGESSGHGMAFCRERGSKFWRDPASL
ncbi:hypothetical protein P4S72_02555 [Vibrio sp. PP-XX7]